MFAGRLSGGPLGKIEEVVLREFRGDILGRFGSRIRIGLDYSFLAKHLLSMLAAVRENIRTLNISELYRRCISFQHHVYRHCIDRV